MFVAVALRRCSICMIIFSKKSGFCGIKAASRERLFQVSTVHHGWNCGKGMDRLQGSWASLLVACSYIQCQTKAPSMLQAVAFASHCTAATGACLHKCCALFPMQYIDLVF